MSLGLYEYVHQLDVSKAVPHNRYRLGYWLLVIGYWLLVIGY